MNKKQNTALMIKAIMLLLALIVMIFVASLAWFAPTDLPNTATGVSVNTSSQVEFEMAVGFESSVNGYQYTMSQYTKHMNLRDIVTVDNTHYDVLHDFSPVDVTGDGVTLVRPSMTTKNADIDRNINTFTTVSPNKEYICFDMYFRSTKECMVYLDSNSYVKGLIEDEPGDGKLIQTTDNSENRKAAEGNYSKDAVVGAVRVSFVDYTQFKEGKDDANRASEARLLWLPRPDIHLNSSGSTGTWSLSTDVEPEAYLDTYGSMQCDTFTHHYYTYVFNGGQYVGEDRNYKDTVTNPSKDAICNLSYKNGDYYYGKTQVKIWIEGCDSEARRTMAGGKFQVNFDLAGG